MDNDRRVVMHNGLFTSTSFFGMLTIICLVMGQVIVALLCGLIAVLLAVCVIGKNKRHTRRNMSVETQHIQGPPQGVYQVPQQGMSQNPSQYGAFHNTYPVYPNSGPSAQQEFGVSGSRMPPRMTEISSPIPYNPLNLTDDLPPPYSSVDPNKEITWMNPSTPVGSEVSPDDMMATGTNNSWDELPSYDVVVSLTDVGH